MTFDAFAAQMARLEGLKFGPPNLHTHWEGLCDVDIDAIERAVTHAVKACEAYPSPAEIRRFAIETAPRVGMDEDRSVPLDEPKTVEAPWLSKPIAVTREWTYYDERCSDTGWESLWCGDPAQKNPWQRLGRCERTEEHAPHEYVQHCACWDSNPAVLKKRERNSQQAAQRTSQKERG